MTKKGLEVLKAVIKQHGAGCIEQVIISHDRNVQKDYYAELSALCKKNKICFRDKAKKYTLRSKYALAVSWRWLIDAGSTKLIVFHDSILPKYRGFSPLVNMLINGEKKLGVSAIIAEKDYDTGPVLARKEMRAVYPLKINDAIENVSGLYAELAVEVLGKIFSNKALAAVKQNEKKATYSLWRDEQDYRIDWSKSAEYIKRFTDSVGFPFKGAATKLEGRTVRILDAETEKDVVIENREPGKLIFIKNGCPVVVCGKGLLRITDMRDDQTEKQLLPFKKLRIRLGDNA